MECAAPRARRIPGPHVPFTPCAPARRRQAPTGANKLRLQLAAAVDHHRAHSWGPPTTPRGGRLSSIVPRDLGRCRSTVNADGTAGASPRIWPPRESRARFALTCCALLVANEARSSGSGGERWRRGRYVETHVGTSILFFSSLLCTTRRDRAGILKREANMIATRNMSESKKVCDTSLDLGFLP